MIQAALVQIKLLIESIVNVLNKRTSIDSNQGKELKISIPTKKKKRPLSTITTPVLPTTSIQAVNSFFDSNKGLMHRFLIQNLQKAIKENKDVVELFRLGNTPIVAKLIEENYENLIDEALKYFIKHEDYKMAQRCQALKDTYAIDKLLQSTK